MPEHTTVLEKAVSRDGTSIGYWRTGEGPALVLVHGTTGDASRWEMALPLLAPHATVHAMDRRGRGASGDRAGYALLDEAADVAAVVDAVADSTGGPVDLLGHSYGATCALEATLLTAAICRLVLYESGIGAVATPPGYTDGLAELLAQDRHEEVVIAILRDFAGMGEEQIRLAMAQPSWPNRVAAAHTVVRELRAHDAYRFEPGRFAALSVPTLLLAGADSPTDETASTAALAAALPGARVVTMAGQGHVAMLTGPDLFSSEVLRFLRGTGS